jgi:hypothetical protein
VARIFDGTYLFDQNLEHLGCDRVKARCVFVNGDLLALFESICTPGSQDSTAPVGEWGARRAARIVPGLGSSKQLQAARVAGKKLEPMP